MKNPYIPHLVELKEVREEVGGEERPVKTFKVVFIEGLAFDYKPGQCGMLGMLGKGESMLAICSSPTMKGYLEFGVLKMGKVTSALHQAEVGDMLTVRGPYGNGFPVEDWKRKNIVFIGGGIGLTPLRSLIYYTIDKREDYERLDLIYGARTSADLCYKKELFEMEKREDINVHLSIDIEEEGWTRYVGFVPSNLLEVKPSAENTIAITCGPPIMIRFVVQNLLKLGFKDDSIYTTLEKRMKCGIGKCGRCNIGNLYVCKDGPVFSYSMLKNLPEAL
jgi:NAD(P)H-flavin reductase